MERTEVEVLDREDPLAGFRERFVIDDSLIYMDGNSLGRLPRATVQAIQTLLDAEWGGELVGAWHHWIELSAKIGDRIAESFLNAHDGEVVVADSTSVNLYKLASAALDAHSSGTRVLTSPDNFPSDLYILQGLCAQRGLELDTTGSIAGDVAFVCLSHVNYMTGEVADMERITREAHEAGALVLWDLSHSVGAIPIDLKGNNVDLAVGCTYKYLNGGPGAPAFLYVAEHLQERIGNPLQGWMGHAEPFAFTDDYRPAAGIGRFLTGTPPVLGIAALEGGLDTFEGVTMERHCPALACITPRAPEQRGSHISFRHPHAYELCQALIEQGVIGDFRAPDVIRFGLTPLYLGFEEVVRAVDCLAGILRKETWREPRFAVRLKVT